MLEGTNKDGRSEVLETERTDQQAARSGKQPGFEDKPGSPSRWSSGENDGPQINSRDSPRDRPGTVTGGAELPALQQGERWLTNRTGQGLEGAIPAQVGDQLRGRSFRTFDDFREAFWQTSAQTPEVRAQFGASNVQLMESKRAPIVPKSEQYGEQKQFVLHHKLPIQHEGAVYDLDNLQVVSPRRHQNILDPGYHFGRNDEPDKS